MTMKIKKFVPFILAFVAGFAVHMYFFSDILPETFVASRPSADVKANSGAIIPTPEFAKSSVYVEYKDRSFHPKTVTSKVANHIYVRNMDKDNAMWLISEANFINTTRPYGLTEQIDFIPHKAGTFVVKNKVNEDATFTVIVKP